MAKPAAITVRNAARRPVVSGSGRTYAPRAEGKEQPDDPINAHLLEVGILAEVDKAKPKPARNAGSTDDNQESTR